MASEPTRPEPSREPIPVQYRVLVGLVLAGYVLIWFGLIWVVWVLRHQEYIPGLVVAGFGLVHIGSAFGLDWLWSQAASDPTQKATAS